MANKSSAGLLAGLGIGVGLLALLIVGVISYASAVAFGAQHENGIKATYENNKQILGSYTTRVAEMAQVPEMARDDLAAVMESAFNGRYGENGSQAAVQLIVEAYPGQIDPALYRNLQTTIEAGRIEFRDNQTILIDKKRTYQQNLDYVFKGFWLRMAGYPKINLDDYNVVTSTSAERSFETGRDDGVTLRRPAPAAQPAPAE